MLKQLILTVSPSARRRLAESARARCVVRVRVRAESAGVAGTVATIQKG